MEAVRADLGSYVNGSGVSVHYLFQNKQIQ